MEVVSLGRLAKLPRVAAALVQAIAAAAAAVLGLATVSMPLRPTASCSAATRPPRALYAP